MNEKFLNQNPLLPDLRSIEDARGTHKPGVWGVARLRSKSRIFGRIDWLRTTDTVIALRLCTAKQIGGHVVFQTTNRIALVERNQLAAFSVTAYTEKGKTND